MAQGEIIDGRGISLKVRAEVKNIVQARRNAGHRAPGLATVLVGEDPASHVYVKNKRKAAEKAGIVSLHNELPADTSQADLLAHIQELNARDDVDGILVQLPLPKHIDEGAVIRAIDPDKDVDGFHPENVARLSLGFRGFVPCTPKGCLRLLRESDTPLEGAHAVVVGRSNIVGKPMAQLLLAENCTVTICHSRTKDMPSVTKLADILVVAVGRPHMIGAEHIKPGAVVLDVGINRNDDGKLLGDVDTEAALTVARAVTPVPRGVGPMTIAMLMDNTQVAHARRLALPEHGVSL